MLLSSVLSRNARKCEKAVVLRLLVAWLSVHTALSEPNRTVHNRVAWLFLPASSVWNSLVFWPFTHGFLSSQVEPNWAKPGKRARVNEVLVYATRNIQESAHVIHIALDAPT